MSYHDTIAKLFAMLYQANMSDTDEAKDWQRPDDSRQDKYYGHIYDAIKAIAGEKIVEHWCETDEIDYSLADREPELLIRFDDLMSSVHYHARPAMASDVYILRLDGKSYEFDDTADVVDFVTDELGYKVLT